MCVNRCASGVECKQERVGGEKKFWGAQDEAETTTRAQERSLSNRVSSKNVYKPANTLLPAVHKKACPRDGHMGVSNFERNKCVPCC